MNDGAPRCLSFEDDQGRTRRVPLAGEVVVGRGEGCTLRLDARNVSRQHARFTASGGAVYVEDLGSRNGTFANDQLVRGRRRVRGGDLVRVGDLALRVVEPSLELDAGAHGAEPPPPPLRAPPADAGDERTIAMAGAAPRPRGWKQALAAALRALGARDE